MSIEDIETPAHDQHQGREHKEKGDGGDIVACALRIEADIGELLREPDDGERNHRRQRQKPPRDNAAELVGEHDANPAAIGNGEHEPGKQRQEGHHRVDRNLGEPARGIERLHIEDVAEANEERRAEPGRGEREAGPERPGRRAQHEQHRETEDREPSGAAARHAPRR